MLLHEPVPAAVAAAENAAGQVGESTRLRVESQHTEAFVIEKSLKKMASRSTTLLADSGRDTDRSLLTRTLVTNAGFVLHYSRRKAKFFLSTGILCS